jgi:hypothetical protein
MIMSSFRFGGALAQAPKARMDRVAKVARTTVMTDPSWLAWTPRQRFGQRFPSHDDETTAKTAACATQAGHNFL